MLNVIDTVTFIAKSKSLYGEYFDYSKTIYTKQKTKLKIICLIHNEFEIPAYLYTIPNRVSGCSQVLPSRSSKYAQIIKRANKILW